VTGNVRTRLPVGTVTDAGTTKLGLSLVSVTIAPPAGATATRESMAVAIPFPDAIAGCTSNVNPWTVPRAIVPAFVDWPVNTVSGTVITG
jgi:hypothetical protein